jgi:MFS family permease/quinol monooxygenase YgiN
LAAPLKVPAFRTIWLAQLAAALGLWMQTVGAQWFLADVGATPTVVSLVQTAATLPVFGFGLLAGVIADRMDRRTLLLIVQSATSAVAGLLVLVTAAGWLTPVLLLVATFALGVGLAFTQPVVAAVMPELVERPLIPAATTLGGLHFNIGRMVGPALGGAIVALAGPWAVFAANMVASLVMVAAIAWWRPTPIVARQRPRLSHAIGAGLRYVRFAPVYRRVLWCATIWVVPACSVQALLPLVAHDRLHLEAGGYGLLLGALGLGAIAGAPLINLLGARFNPNRLFLVGAVIFAASTAVIAWGGSAVAVALALFVGGSAWMVVLTTISTAGQLVLPTWVRGRAMAVFLLVFFGGQAIGAVIWGALATALTLPVSLLISGGTLIASGILAQWYGMRPLAGVDPVLDPRDPAVSAADAPDGDGHVLLVVEYDVQPSNVDAFREALPLLGQSRRRTGARRWAAYQDTAEPTRFVETYELPSWTEHVSQTLYRQTRGESRLVADVLALVDRTVASRTLVSVADAARAGSAPPPLAADHSGR